MKNWDWQFVIVITAVGTAVIFLMRRTIRFFSNDQGTCATGCGACASSPSKATDNNPDKAFVALDSLTVSSPKEPS